MSHPRQNEGGSHVARVDLLSRNEDVSVDVNARGQIGIVRANAGFDLDNLQAGAQAEAITAGADANAGVDTVVGGAGAGAYAQGPSADAGATIGLDGVGAGAGISAGEVGAHANMNIGDEEFRWGVDIGPKLEARVQVGPTIKVDLPVISAEVPNPVVVVGTVGKSVANEAIELAGGAINAAGGLLGLDREEHSPNAVTNDSHTSQRERERVRNAPPGTVLMDEWRACSIEHLEGRGIGYERRTDRYHRACRHAIRYSSDG
jgi:hypothetical protein